ncbi:hypothetical protein AAC387_Pa06g2389 [Persea americana]
MIGSLNIIHNWYFSLAVLVLTISFTQFSQATNTLEIGQSITDGQTLVSAGENFVLGFFSPGNSTNRYVGVWYYRVPEQTVIWVANGRNPIPNKNSGVLTITRDGSFMILDSSRGSSYLLANGSSLKNPSAKILDTGNLVFGETNPDGNEGKILWQSFDYPTDSLLPYMKLVLNKSTGENHVLTSWRSAEDPAPGEYAFGVDTNGNINIWKNGISQWKSRARNGQIFTAAPDLSSTYILNFSSPSDEKVGSFSYTTNNNSVITRLVIRMTGQMNRFSWSVSRQMWILYWEQPKRGCNVSSLCGAYGICSESAFPTCECLEGFEPASVRDWTAGVWSVGCRRKIKLRCGVNRSVDEGDDVFVKLSKVGFGKAQPQPLRIGSQEECKVACMRNCSCFAYAYEKGCYVWEGDLFNLQQLQDDDETGRDIYLRVARERKEAPTSSDPSRQRKDKLDKGWNKDPGLHVFSFAQISAVTNNFSLANKLGQGGFGPVYKGNLLGGEEIAVKRLSKSSGQGIEEFKNEVTLIANVQHTNLVKLLGCCTEGEEKMLIYEYMPNKSLDSFLFDPSKKKLLDWTKRIHIIDGIAQGLLYLHTYSRLRIIHRDLKASNILLDGEMNPKISDFGLARIVDRNESRANTNRVVGTYGYMSPEYAMEGVFSVKSDVYSFGVLLLEIVTGNKNSNFYCFDRSLNLLAYAWELWKEGKIIELMDRSLVDSSVIPELTRYLHVALLCVQESASSRPSMSDAVSMLRNEVVTLPVAMKPAFLIRRPSLQQQSERSKQEAVSTNDASISTLEAR